MLPQEIVNKLRAAGLTDGESRVYLALLQLGETTTGPIVEQSQISSSKIYDILDRLEKKGLTTHVVKNNRKIYSTTDPRHLESFLELRDREMHDAMAQLKQIAPQLAEMKTSAGPPQEVIMAEGAQAMKVAVTQGLEQMKKGDTYYLMGVPKESFELFPFFNEWHLRRIQKGVRCKMLFNQAVKKLGEIRKRMPLTEVRYLPENIFTPTLINIAPARETLTITLFGDRPFILTIVNKKLTDSFLTYFNLLWEIAKA